jgi:DNA-binding transcriptional ArsR family regulator
MQENQRPGARPERIINLLLRSRLCVCEMAAILDLPQPLLSRHLAYLRNGGLVEGPRQGLRINYEDQRALPSPPADQAVSGASFAQRAPRPDRP